ncbi:MAG: hypothetical protein AB4042_15680 [Leptolyngbyaceae cyanobacterium]
MTQSTELSATNSTQSNESGSVAQADEDKVEIAVALDSDLLRQIKFLTDDPSKVIEVAVRQWLRGGARRDDDLTRNLERNPPVPARGEWND